jgi:hypothetical protein
MACLQRLDAHNKKNGHAHNQGQMELASPGHFVHDE